MGRRQNEKPTESRQPPQAPKFRKPGPNDNDLAIAALNDEARRRRISYGKLVGLLAAEQQAQIIKKFRERRKK